MRRPQRDGGRAASPLRAVLVDGGWREIDTEQDLARADRVGRATLAGVTCPAAIPRHWLHRLDAAEWLAAAATELAHAEEKLARARPSAPA